VLHIFENEIYPFKKYSTLKIWQALGLKRELKEAGHGSSHL
jgi:hypothetical protein